MKKLLIISTFIALFFNSCISDYEQIDYYIADTTLQIWSEKFNYAIVDVNPDTIENGVDSLLIWASKVNTFINTVPTFEDDTITYGLDDFEAWRNKFNNALAAYLDSVLTDSLVLHLQASSISSDSLTYNSTSDLVTYASVDTVVLDGSSEVVIGNSVRFGTPTSGTIYQVLQSYNDTLILDQTFTGSVTDEFYWGGVNTWYDLSDSLNHATQTTAINQPKLLWVGTDSAKVKFNGSTSFMRFTEFTLSYNYNLFFNIARKSIGTTQSVFGANSNFFQFTFFNSINVLVHETNTNGNDSRTSDAFINDIDYKISINVINRECQVYTNGVVNNMFSTTLLNDYTVNKIGISSTASYLNAEMSEIRIYSRFLTEKQIKELSR